MSEINSVYIASIALMSFVIGITVGILIIRKFYVVVSKDSLEEVWNYGASLGDTSFEESREKFEIIYDELKHE
jgi:uncharacterized membrane-anchored protein YhcB (DUF1043 family)